jgi:hypothetical protein
MGVTNKASGTRTRRLARALLGLVATAIAAAGPPPAPTHGPAHRAARPDPAKPGSAAPAQAVHPAQPDPTGPEAAMARDPALRRCRDLLGPLSPSESPPGPVSVEAAGPDECRFHNIRVGLGGFVGYRMDALLVRGIPFERPQGPLAPVHARVEARGITLAIRDQPAKLAWMSRQQQVPFDLVLDATYDPATTTLTLNEFSMDGALLGHVGLRAGLENVHLLTTRADALPAMQAPPGLRSLHLELDSRTFLSSYVLPLIMNLLPDEDPDAAFQTGRAKGIAAINALLPASGASTDTTVAVAQLLSDFPHPKHPAVLDIEANTPITPDAVLAAVDDPGRLPALLQALTVTATYAGALR